MRWANGVVSILALIAISIVCISIGITINARVTTAARQKHREEVSALASRLGNNLQQKLGDAVAATIALSGFVHGRGTIPINHNTTNKTERMQVLDEERYHIFARDLRARFNYLGDLQLQPSAVVTQSWPNTGAKGHDLLYDPKRSQDVMNTYQGQKPLLAGPFQLIQGGFGLFVRYPVWLSDEKNWTTWWGLCGVLVFVDRLLNQPDAIDIENVTQGYYYDLSFWNQNINSRSQIQNNTGPVTNLTEILETADPADAPIAKKILLSGGSNWDLVMMPKEDWDGQVTVTGYLALVVISIAAAAAIVTLAHGLIFGAQRMRESSARTAVPKGRVALVFTDVQDSTEIWELDQDAMRFALQYHNELIRDMLDKYGGYEVKTEGDAFFIAFPVVDDAVQCCLAIQQGLLDLPWPEDSPMMEMPICKPAFERCKVDGAGPETSKCIWNGLRVRMGIHVGNPDMVFSEETMKGDFFGPVVNTAARVAGHARGGEITVSYAAWNEVKEATIKNTVTKDLGLIKLKGIADPVQIMSVLPASLSMRSFVDRRKDVTLHTTVNVPHTRHNRKHMGGTARGPWAVSRRLSGASSTSRRSDGRTMAVMPVDL